MKHLLFRKPNFSFISFYLCSKHTCPNTGGLQSFSKAFHSHHKDLLSAVIWSLCSLEDMALCPLLFPFLFPKLLLFKACQPWAFFFLLNSSIVSLSFGLNPFLNYFINEVFHKGTLISLESSCMVLIVKTLPRQTAHPQAALSKSRCSWIPH